MAKNIKDAKVHFIVGKGGVGKTVLARALAQVCAQKKKTLLVELGEEPYGDNGVKIAPIMSCTPKLSYVKIHPDQTVYEYLALKIHSQKILDALQEKSLFRALCAAMPGLSDLTRLGKIWYHADEVHGLKGQIFDHIVVDMPSTGFVGRLLSIPAVVYDAVKIGPVAQEAKMMRDYFADENHARIHMVTCPEDLIVQETIELYRELLAKNFNLGYLVVNRVCSSHIKPPDKDFADKPELNHILSAMKKRELEEEVLLQRLHQDISLPTIMVDDTIEHLDDSGVVSVMHQALMEGFFS